MSGELPGYTWIDNPKGGGGEYATAGPSTILLHMTVSMSLSASYVSQHAYPPHCWANPYTGDKWQTVPLDRSAYALWQTAYGAWTNREGYTIQTELVGVPQVNVQTYTDAQLRWIAANVVVPQAQWLASVGRPVDLTQVCYHTDSSGSASADWHGRMTDEQWDAFNGVCCHIDIPGNDHWDCSVERIDLIAQYARELLGGGGVTPPKGSKRPMSYFTVQPGTFAWSTPQANYPGGAVALRHGAVRPGDTISVWLTMGGPDVNVNVQLPGGSQLPAKLLCWGQVVEWQATWGGFTTVLAAAAAKDRIAAHLRPA